jgi:hypothetical protein
MNLRRSTIIALICGAVVVTPGCVRTDEGLPVAEPTAASGTALTPPGSFVPTTATAQPEPGVLPTQQVPIPAGTVTCPLPPKPGTAVEATVSDPQAPKITVGIPDGWSFTRGSGDVATKMTGPEAMTATVTIERTGLAPADAFRGYADRIMSASAISTVSVLPAELCQYSGQKLMGTWADTPGNSVEFRDRIAHIWTNTANYLVAVHVQAPAGADDLDAAAAWLTGDVQVEIP